MKFFKLSEYFSKIESTTSRNEITVTLAEMFRESSREEIDTICYLSLGRLAPLYEGVEFNLAEKMMFKVLASAYGEDVEEVRKTFKESGDLGEVGEHLARKNAKKIRKSTKLSVGEVYGQLRKVAEVSGAGSQDKKVRGMAELLQKLDPLSVRYIVRIPLGKLRLGFSEMTILDALSWMVVGDKSARKEVEAAFNVRADVGQIAALVKSGGLKGIRNVGIDLGTPVISALCQRLPTAEEIIEKVGRVAVEPKYDGTRLQVHFSRARKMEDEEVQLGFDFHPTGRRGFVRIFTRNLENTTHMFPDLIGAFFDEVKAREAILDGEAIGFDPKTGKFLPFQETIKRKRKHGIGQKAQEIPLKFFCFDILRKDEEDLWRRPLRERRKALEEVLPSANQVIVTSPQIVTEDPQELRRYHREQIKRGLEGVVVKKWGAPYEPGRRGYTWVKLKQEKGKKGGGLADTLDCVVMGYYRGRGKRTQFGVGAFLVGVRGGPPPSLRVLEDNQFLTISKIGTGLTDEQWKELKARSDECKAEGAPKGYRVDKNLAPDIWCSPKIIVEIEADNITKSPIHTAKYALRFPRLVRFRDDKSPEQATTVKEVEELFGLQKGR